MKLLICLWIIHFTIALDNVNTEAEFHEAEIDNNLRADPSEEDSRRFIIVKDDVKRLNYEESLNHRIQLRNLREKLDETLSNFSLILTDIINSAANCNSPYVPMNSFPQINTRKKRDLHNLTTSKTNNETENSRRSMNVFMAEKNEVKNKLFYYIKDTFTEIENKMGALKTTKQLFENEDVFKIGYIIANIDTLEVNMGNLKKELDRNKGVWTERKIFDVYDTVMKSNRALSNLSNILNKLAENIRNTVVRKR